MSWVTVAIAKASDRVEIHVGAGPALVANAPEAVGEGPGPFDLLLASLGACTVVTLKRVCGGSGLAVGGRRGRP